MYHTLGDIKGGVRKSMGNDEQEAGNGDTCVKFQKGGAGDIDSRSKFVSEVNVTDGKMESPVLDLLSVHLVRRKESSTIISHHPSHDNFNSATKASYLQNRTCFAGKSVYWQSIFQHSPDPTFVLLTFVWHAFFETELLITTINAETFNTQQLYKIRAHLLYYLSLLEDFRKTVEFIRVTHNPALDAPEISEEQRNLSKNYMKCECAKLLEGISRLELERSMQDKWLENVMCLVFSSVNLIDNKYMQEMTQAAVRDSAAMKQIAYLTMIFLPASFIATVFGMNVKEFSPDTNGTLSHYFSTAIPMTIATIWIIVAFQIQNIYPGPVNAWRRVAWPVLMMINIFSKDASREKEDILPRFNHDI
ncbi:hypothetical protein BDQ17DRAFT_1332598 [Cyathus striatus]|nr:hypothetical protein BDQ17DRAFT_1332598 [Cyathus striatus]